MLRKVDDLIIGYLNSFFFEKFLHALRWGEMHFPGQPA